MYSQQHQDKLRKYTLELAGIEKTFPGVKALSSIDLNVETGTLHVLCGENGAGKSTLCKIINGLYQPDRGTIKWNGLEREIGSPLEARELGISMIFQELSYIPEMSVEENLFLGVEPTHLWGKIDKKEQRKRALSLLAKEALNCHPRTKLKSLSVAQIQMLEIVKALHHNASLIIMDEPTSAISEREVTALFQKIELLKSKGVTFIYISHKMDEIFEIADTISVLRDGQLIETREAAQFDIDTVIKLMVGRDIKKSSLAPPPAGSSEELLRVENLSSPPQFENVSFHINKGEIVGLAGLMGAGRTEVASALFGLDENVSGDLFIRGKKVDIRSPKEAIANGLAMVSEDRRRYGTIGTRDVKENTTLSSLDKFFPRKIGSDTKERGEVERMFEMISVKTASLSTPISKLSGGNQQKILFARWMLREPDLLLLDEPTRGIDIGAKSEIYKIVSHLAERGRSLLLISSELPELVNLCHRVYVMAMGRISGELSRSELSQEAIMRLAAKGATL